MEVVIIGSGFAGSVIARKLVEHRQDIEVTIYEKRNHIGGNMYDEVDENGVLIQKYGVVRYVRRDDCIYAEFC